MQKILLTGGLGYIGSHCCIQLLEAGKNVFILDNLSNSNKSILDRIKTITGKSPEFIEGDIGDETLLDTIFSNNNIHAIIHMAGLKAVKESVEKPLLYYKVNVEGSRRLIQAAVNFGVNHFVFSSSATVYGEPEYLPFDEEHPLRTTNPYGESKRIIEEMLRSVETAHPKFKIGILRYFNPIGAHSSGLIGEDPKNIPNNLMPYIAKVATGEYPHLNVFGDDYDTCDGTGVRDYIHVDDLVNAHTRTLDYIIKEQESVTLNLGTGKGFSVLELINTFADVSGKSIPIIIAPRRDGDIPESYASSQKAKKLIGWEAEHDITRMCEDVWRWVHQNSMSNSRNH